MAIDKNIIQSLLNDIESDRAERTISVNNTDKFGQAICAFVNDYRNAVIAEALRVLGFVNRFSRGVQRVENDLMENGNGQPEFDLSLGTAFKVIVRKAHMDETEKETENPSSKFSLSEPQRKVFHLLCMNSDITYAELMRQTNLSRSYLSRIISALKEHGYVVRKGSDYRGE